MELAPGLESIKNDPDPAPVYYPQLVRDGRIAGASQTNHWRYELVRLFRDCQVLQHLLRGLMKE